MISDVLADAVSNVDGYLNAKTFRKAYSGNLREEIIALRNKMEAMIVLLDVPIELSAPEEKAKILDHWATKLPKGLSKEVLALYVRLYDEKPTPTIEEVLARLM
jgi:hypothetical protein